MGLAVQDRGLTRRVGAVALFVLGGLVILQLTFDGCNLYSGFEVTVYYGHLGGLREGSRVQVAGRVVGEVTGIALVPTHRAPEGHPLHPDGGVALTVRIENRYAHMTTVNGEYFISARGAFGEKFIEAGAPPGGLVPGRPLRRGDEVRGIDPPRMGRVMLRTWENLQNSKAFVDAVRPEGKELLAALTALSGTLASLGVGPDDSDGVAQLRAALAGTADAARRVREKWESNELAFADIARLLDRTRETSRRIDAVVADIGDRIATLRAALATACDRIPRDLRDRLERVAATAEDGLRKARNVAATFNEIVDIVEHGEGTVGALLHDPEFPEDAKELGRVIKRRPWQLFGRPKD